MGHLSSQYLALLITI